MSYIAFELDALNVVPSVAAAAGMRAGDISYGLLTMWAYCFREETAQISPLHVIGFFGAECAPALVAFGFLEPAEGGFRVRGAERYLRVKQAQREGGKKGRALSSSRLGRNADDTSGSTSGSTLRSTSGSTSGSQQALTPNTEHRAPNTEHHKDCADAQPPRKAPKAKRAEQPADPRHQPLVQALDEAFREARGTAYPYKPRDFAAVKSLLAAGAPEVILAAWRRALAHRGYPSVSSPSELHQHLAHFVGNAAAPVDPKATRAPSPVPEWTSMTTGEVNL